MKKISLGLAIALAGLATAGSALAVDLSINPGTSNPPTAGGTVSGVTLVSANTTNSRGWNVTFQLPTGVSAANVVAATGAAAPLGSLGQCNYDNVSNRIIVLAGDISGERVAGTACTFDLTFPAGADGTQFVIEQTAPPGCTAVSGSCTTTVTDAFPSGDPGAGGVPEAHVGTSTAAPVPRTLSYAPAAGSLITFPAGVTPGTAATDQVITVTATGTAGNATLSGCAISGAGAAAFDVDPTSLSFTTSTSLPLNVGCTYPTADASAVLTCSETDGDSTAAARTWNLSCPAPNANPAVAESPATGTPISVGGAPAGDFGVALLSFLASGGSGTGSATINCSSTGSVELALGGATPSGQTANQSVTGAQQPQQVRIGVVLNLAGQPAAGDVSCSITDAAGTRVVSYAISAPAGSVGPEFIPASSLWSQFALIALFLGLGGLMLVVRRNG